MSAVRNLRYLAAKAYVFRCQENDISPIEILASLGSQFQPTIREVFLKHQLIESITLMDFLCLFVQRKFTLDEYIHIARMVSSQYAPALVLSLGANKLFVAESLMKTSPYITSRDLDELGLTCKDLIDVCQQLIATNSGSLAHSIITLDNLWSLKDERLRLCALELLKHPLVSRVNKSSIVYHFPPESEYTTQLLTICKQQQISIQTLPEPLTKEQSLLYIGEDGDLWQLYSDELFIDYEVIARIYNRLIACSTRQYIPISDFHIMKDYIENVPVIGISTELSDKFLISLINLYKNKSLHNNVAEIIILKDVGYQNVIPLTNIMLAHNVKFDELDDGKLEAILSLYDYIDVSVLLERATEKERDRYIRILRK